MRQSLLADLNPVGSLEALLVERSALCLWRLRRFEAGFMGNGMNAEARHSPYGEFVACFNTADKLVLFTRYETAIERSLYRALGSCAPCKPLTYGVPPS